MHWVWGMLMAVQAEAAVYQVEDGGLVEVPLDVDRASVVVTPDWIETVTPSPLFEVVPLGVTDKAPSTKRLEIRWKPGVEATAEAVTLFLHDGRSVAVRFMPATEVVDNLVSVRFERPQNARRRSVDPRADERSLMKRMIVDEASAGRRVVNEELEYLQYSELRFTLRRTYRSRGLSGYVFVVQNRTRKPLLLDPTVLAVGRPNRLALVHVDHEVLAPCHEDPSDDPHGTGCRTAMRLLVREEALGRQPAMDGAVGARLPFVQVPKGSRAASRVSRGTSKKGRSK